MRRLVGLIALLVLILGGAWLARNDFDISRIPEFDALFGPADDGGAAKAPPEEVASSPAAESAAAPQASQTVAEGEVPSEATAAAEAEPTGSETIEASRPSATTAEPAPASDGMAAADLKAPAAGTVTAPETPAAETEVNAATSAPANAEAAPVVVPSFDIVRVEPTGETVVAGVAEPQAKVEVLSGPQPVATAEANERGEWALVLEKPLPPGTHDLAIRTTSKDLSRVTLSDQRVAVSVPESADEEPLVVLNEPDAPSKVIQLPAEAGTAAAPESAGGPGTQQSEAMSGAPTPAAETKVAAVPQAEPVTKTPSSSGADEVLAPKQTEPATEMPASAAEETASAPSGAEPSAAAVETPAKAGSASSPTAEPSTPSEAADATMAAVEPATSSGQTAPAASSQSRIAMGETVASSAPASASSTGAAVVPPASQEEPSAAKIATTEPAGPPTAAKPEPESLAAGEAPLPVTPKVGVAAVEAETNGTLYIAGTATTPEPVRVYVDDEFLGETTPTESGTWLLETKREMAPDEYTIRADQVDTSNGEVIARAEVPFERQIEVATLKPTGQSVSGGTAEVSGSVAGPMKVIIKRGDNLWRISREMYGHGIRYSTIYQANRDQIRNPNLIYPGQVFVLPAGDTSWQN